MALNFDGKMEHYKLSVKELRIGLSFDLHSLVFQLFAKLMKLTKIIELGSKCLIGCTMTTYLLL
jgi:hypothetical protein